MVRLIRFSSVLCFLLFLFVSSPLFADTLVRSGEAFDRDFVVLSDSHASTFHADFLRGCASADAKVDFDWGNWAHDNVDDRDGDQGHHWGWYNEHKRILNSNGGGWEDDDGGSKSDPAVPEPSVLVLLVGGLVGLFLASALNKLRA